MSLKDKVVLITGGTGALGSVIAQTMVEEGARVVVSSVTGRDRDNLPESLTDSVIIYKADVTDEIQVASLFDAILKQQGHIDVLINTVGGFLPSKPITDVSVQEWDSMMNINLKSTFLCTREALRCMKNQPYGRIINISAMVGLRPTPGKAAYAISKAGVSLFTDIVAQEQKATGITVNAIAPSIIATRANLASLSDEDSSKWVKPEEIAALICYLCSDAAAAISGTTVKVYGGV